MIAVEIVGHFCIEDTPGSLYLAEQSRKIIRYLAGQLCIVIIDKQSLMDDELTLNGRQQA